MATETLPDATLARMLHLDVADEITNASVYKGMAEEYLTNAGCTIDYDSKLYTGMVIIIVSKMLDNPSLLSNLTESTGIFLNGLITQYRLKCEMAVTT